MIMSRKLSDCVRINSKRIYRRISENSEIGLIVSRPKKISNWANLKDTISIPTEPVVVPT